MPLSTAAATRKDKANANSATFEHRHFAFIAGVLARLHSIDNQDRTWVADYFAEQLANTNPRFDRERFLKASNAAERI